MRLIDAEKIQIPMKMVFSISGCYMMRVVDVQRIISEQPTAFDKEKVIGELRAEAERWHESGVAYDDEREKGVAEGFRRAMPIVEKGGVA